MSDGGIVSTDRYRPPGHAPSSTRILRWLLAPLQWRDFAPAGGRARAVAQRLRHLLAGRPQASNATGRTPAGWLHAVDGGGRLPLYAAVHPVTGDQLLSRSKWEGPDMGYTGLTLLGFLEADAPVTSGLGTRRPSIPWASRHGQRFRDDGS
jgi:hypothetical protein